MDGCGYWRMWLPHLHIEKSQFMFTEGYPQIDEMAESDVAIVQRLMLKNNIAVMQLLRSHGVRLVYDLDDDLWHIPKANPAHNLYKDPEMVRGLDACSEWASVVTVSTEPLKKIVESQWSHLRNTATKKPIPVVVIENRVDVDTFKPVFDKDEQKENIVIG